jgi:hypothetical protein
MKNVTISMDEALLRAVRIEAAKAGKSVSKFIGEVMALKVESPLADDIDPKRHQLEALEQFLKKPKVRLSDENGMMPTRDWIYARENLR